MRSFQCIFPGFKHQCFPLLYLCFIKDRAVSYKYSSSMRFFPTYDFLNSHISSDSLSLCRSWRSSATSLLLPWNMACVLQDVLFTFSYVFICVTWNLPTLSPFIPPCFSSLLPLRRSLPNLICPWQFLQVSLKSVECGV